MIAKLITAIGITGVLLLVIVLIATGPLIIIWSLNTLFDLQIAYTFWTWLAAFCLAASLKASTAGNSR